MIEWCSSCEFRGTVKCGAERPARAVVSNCRPVGRRPARVRPGNIQIMLIKCSPGQRTNVLSPSLPRWPDPYCPCSTLPSSSLWTRKQPNCASTILVRYDAEKPAPAVVLLIPRREVHSSRSKHGGSKRSPPPNPTHGPKRQPSGNSAAKRFDHAVPIRARASSRLVSAAAASRRPGAGVAVSIRREGRRSGGGAAIDSASNRCASRSVASSNARCIADGCAGLPCHRSPSAIGSTLRLQSVAASACSNRARITSAMRATELRNRS